ncbi:nuclease-related domain-containing protein [Nocardia asteroides]|uniref:nuclease-related domain-containing protein n=1 Tax=Nocardia asteroides TaxID=1824 RepID=UPI0037C7BC1F
MPISTSQQWRLDMPGLSPTLLMNEALRAHKFVARDAKRQVADAVRRSYEQHQHRLPPITGPVCVYVIWWRGDRLICDSDSLAAWEKAALDALRQAGALKGDDHRYVTDVAMRVMPGSDSPGMSILLMPNPERELLLPGGALALHPIAASDAEDLVDLDLASAADQSTAAIESGANSAPTPQPMPPPSTSQGATNMFTLQVRQEVEPSSSEQLVGYALRDSGIAGVMVWGCRVPTGKGWGREIDLLVITPTAVAVVEVKGTPRGVAGTIACTTNSRWEFGDGREAVLTSGTAKDGKATNPVKQLESQIFAIQSVLRQTLHSTDVFVNGCVAVVPNGEVTLNVSTALPPGTTVLLVDDPDVVVHYIRGLANRSSKIDAQAALKVLRALEFGPNQVTTQDLVAAGFPDNGQQEAATESRPSPTSTPRTSELAPVAPATQRPVQLLPKPSPVPEVALRPGRSAPSPLGLAFACAAVAALGYMALTVANDGGAPAPPPPPAQVQPSAPDTDGIGDSTEQATTRPLPTRKAPPPPACYPFSPGC